MDVHSVLRCVSITQRSVRRLELNRRKYVGQEERQLREAEVEVVDVLDFFVGLGTVRYHQMIL